MTLVELESAATRRLGKFIAFVHLLFPTHQSTAQKVFLKYFIIYLFISPLPLIKQSIAQKVFFSILLPHILNLISHFDGAVVSLSSPL